MKLRRESPTPPNVSDVSADAMGWSGLEPLEPRLLLAGTAPVFLEPLGDHLTTQDESFTVVIDSFDADGDALTISATSTNPDVVPTITQNGTFARLNFVDDLGADMGYIMIELFSALTPNTVDRFITLATNELSDDGQGGVDLDPNGTPYYTDVVVHRVIDDFMIQTGDAEFGNGTGGSLLGPFADEFDPSLDFSGTGVVAMANSGADTQDSQFFITEVPTPGLNGVHTIFGQMLSGWDLYHTIMGLPTDAGDRPEDPPLLQSVEIFDTVVSLAAPDDYVGAADITVSLDDGNGNVTEDTFTMTYDADVTDPVVTVNPLTTADNTPTLTGTIVDEDDAAIVVTVNGVDYDATNNGGRVIIPAFSLGRTQQVVYFLNQLTEEGLLPEIPVFVDSPLSTRLTGVFQHHQSLLDEEARRLLLVDDDLFQFPKLTYIRSQRESVALNRRKGPFVVISASGMCENGRVVHHLKHAVADERNTIVIIGYQAGHTLGRRLVERQPYVRIFDREFPLKAKVEKLNGLSAHADAEDFRWWFQHLADHGGVGQAFLVHGETDAAQSLATVIRDFCDEDPVIPQLFESYDI